MSDLIHRRAQIRRDVKALLVDLEAGHGNVFVGLSWPTGPEKLPCLVIDTPVEQVASETTTAIRQNRRQQLKVQGRVAGNNDDVILDQLDEQARQVEAKLLTAAAANALGLMAIELIGTQVAPVRAETDMRVGTIELTFLCTPATIEGAPHTAV